MPSFEDIELQINNSIDKRLNKFARLVRDELGLDLENITSEKLKKLTRGGNSRFKKGAKNSLKALIKEAGLDSLSDVIISFFDGVEKESARLLFNSTKIDLDRLNEIAINRAEVIADLGLQNDLDKIEKDLSKRFRKGLQVRKLKNLNKSQTSEYIKSLLNLTKAQTETAVATSVMGYDRAVTTIKANEVGLHKFKYAGADDSKNRKFCKTRVGNVYFDSEAKRWRNGQKEPAFIYLGGYNCRHRKVYQVD